MGPPLGLTHRAQPLAGEVEDLAARFGPTPALDRYRDEYEAALEGRAAHPGELSPSLSEASLVLLADTHTLPGSQRRTVRVLEEMAAEGGALTLVLEWIDRSFQPQVDAFLAGELGGDALRRAILFDETWGFAWGPYLEVLEAARSLGVPVLLVDSLLEHHELRRRDRDIVRAVARSRGPGRRTLVVYGGYHLLGRDHLSERLTARGHPPDLVLVDDAPAAYWAALEAGADPTTLRWLDLGAGVHLAADQDPRDALRSVRDYYAEVLDEDPEEWDEDEAFAAPRALGRVGRSRAGFRRLFGLSPSLGRPRGPARLH